MGGNLFEEMNYWILEQIIDIKWRKMGGGGFMAFTQFLQGCQEILQQVLVLDDSLFNWSCRGR